MILQVSMAFCIMLALYELHGNSNVERCKKCKIEYLRDFRCSGGSYLTGKFSCLHTELFAKL